MSERAQKSQCLFPGAYTHWEIETHTGTLHPVSCLLEKIHLEMGFEDGDRSGLFPYVFWEAVSGIGNNQKERTDSLKRAGQRIGLVKPSFVFFD